ncbi:MAG TPA: hypothetical protein DDW30_07675 [Clostridiales bacterium]|nr:hypothetical protein [Clostridiales bacterium]
MKKFLSLMLAGVMSASLFAVGAAAETVVGAGDGVESFDDTSNGSDINVKVNDVTHKYAVDLTFDFKDLTLGNITWNVNDMRYDVETELKDSTQSIQVSNRSDQSVYAYVTIVDGDSADGVIVGMAENADGRNSKNRLEIGKANAGTTGSTGDVGKGTATSETLDINLSSTDWNAVAVYYAQKREATPEKDSYKLATVTVTISANATEQ